MDPYVGNPITDTITVPSGELTRRDIFMQLRDEAGNESNCIVGSIEVDTVAPMML